MRWIIIFIMLFPCYASTQNIRIGDLAISDSLAKEYFLDCHTHPDTIRNQPYKEGEWFHQKLLKKIKWYNKKTYNHSPKELPMGLYIIVPREPSAADFRDWFIKQKISAKSTVVR